MRMPKISVIVPVYNSGKYLGRCIDSIIAQKFYEFECILIDDCSFDNSLEICKKYSSFDKRIIVHHKEKNEGTAQARKTGINIASADYILFLDNDDWIEPEMLEELYMKAVSQDYDMVYCDYYNDTDTKSIYCHLSPPPPT
jgi:glycosyltransferase involved in cell wall biosynthesis